MKFLPLILAGLLSLLFGSACVGQQENSSEKPSVQAMDLDAQLMQAIFSGDREKAVALIKNGANANARNENQSSRLTALHYAAEKGYLDVVEALVGRGAKLDAEGIHYRGTPLVLALAHGHEAVARFLISRGANAAYVDSAGYTPLHNAAGSTSPEMLALLIAKGANVNAKSEIGRLPLYDAIARERWDNAKFLIEKGADIQGNIGEGTALMMAPLAIKKL